MRFGQHVSDSPRLHITRVRKTLKFYPRRVDTGRRSRLYSKPSRITDADDTGICDRVGNMDVHNGGAPKQPACADGYSGYMFNGSNMR
jgi:hypothetical protein